MSSTERQDGGSVFGHVPQISTFGYCSWHQDHSRGVRLINVHEQGSGPGGGAFACRPCREKHGLVPFADRPLDAR